jgi:hypothetical protein
MKEFIRKMLQMSGELQVMGPVENAFGINPQPIKISEIDVFDDTNHRINPPAPNNPERGERRRPERGRPEVFPVRTSERGGSRPPEYAA